MGISYKSLLPKMMQDTRWGQFIDAFQSVMDDIVTEKVNPIKTRFDINQMTTLELMDMSARLGYNITYLDGYTSSDLYLIKEISSILWRVISKTTRQSYLYIYQIFNLIGDTYPIHLITQDNATAFQVQDNYWVTPISRVSTQTLDQVPALTLDSQLIFDNNIASTEIPIRHFVLSYKNRFIEDSTQFISNNTLQAFFHDVKSTKRITEIPYFEPKIPVNIPIYQSGVVITTSWLDYNLVSYSNQKSILFTSNLSGIASVQLGCSGYINNPTYASNGVQCLTYTIQNNTSGMQAIETYTPVKFHSRKLVTEKFKFMDSNSGQMYFTEMALMNNSGQCICYSTFPKIQWYPYMYQNIAFEVNLV